MDIGFLPRCSYMRPGTSYPFHPVYRSNPLPLIARLSQKTPLAQSLAPRSIGSIERQLTVANIIISVREPRRYAPAHGALVVGDVMSQVLDGTAISAARVLQESAEDAVAGNVIAVVVEAVCVDVVDEADEVLCDWVEDGAALEGASAVDAEGGDGGEEERGGGEECCELHGFGGVWGVVVGFRGCGEAVGGCGRVV